MNDIRHLKVHFSHKFIIFYNGRLQSPSYTLTHTVHSHCRAFTSCLRTHKNKLKCVHILCFQIYQKVAVIKFEKEKTHMHTHTHTHKRKAHVSKWEYKNFLNDISNTLK